MNKLHILALTLLVLCGVNNTSAMGQEQREILYTLHSLEKNFADVPMIIQNLDIFVGVLEMNIQITESKVAAATQKVKKSLLQGAVLCGGVLLAQNFSAMGIDAIRNHYSGSESMFDVVSKVRTIVIDGFILNDLLGLVTIGKVVAALHIYDAWKHRSVLLETLALDKEILGKLQEVKDSMSFLEENADSAGNILLKGAE